MGQAVLLNIFEAALRGDQIGYPVGLLAGAAEGNDNFIRRFQDKAEPFAPVVKGFGIDGMSQRIILRYHK
ncbi:hypothetical protein D3C76_1523410 [compost metagenome]